METVAQYLKNQALAQTSPSERDRFARSSFNRYYYATYLRVKRGLTEMSPIWGNIAHASMPQLLRGQIRSKIKTGLAQSQRINDRPLISCCSTALKAALYLAEVLDEGRMARVTADYYPEKSVDFTTKSNFQLNSITIENAKLWHRRADMYMRNIEKAWREISV